MVELADVDRFQKIYDRLHADALGVDESQEFMRDVLGKHDD
jgi:hypothetical protein